jgi:hypothetical protein
MWISSSSAFSPQTDRRARHGGSALSSIPTELAAALAAVDRPGDFYASGMTELHTPRLEVEGVGLVALPVL